MVFFRDIALNQPDERTRNDAVSINQPSNGRRSDRSNQDHRAQGAGLFAPRNQPDYANSPVIFTTYRTNYRGTPASTHSGAASCRSQRIADPRRLYDRGSTSIFTNEPSVFVLKPRRSSRGTISNTFNPWITDCSSYGSSFFPYSNIEPLLPRIAEHRR